MKSSKALKIARERITNPENWTKGAYFRNAEGISVRRDKATCMCSFGALRVAYDCDTDYGYPGVNYLERAIEGIIGRRMSIDVFNDHQEHPTVLKAFDNAIALALANDD